MMNFNKKRKPVEIVFMVLFMIAMAFAIGTATKMVWNAIMPELFGLPTITFLQLLGLAFLGRVIFGGGHHRSHRNKHDSHWSSDWHEKHSQSSAADDSVEDVPADDQA